MGLEAKMDMSSEDLVKSKGGNYCGFKTQKSASLCIVALFVCGAVIAASVAAIIIVPHLQSNADASSRKTGETTPTPAPIIDSSSQIVWPDVPQPKYQHASVACAEKNCSTIGVQMLAEGGSAVDAAIAVSLCLGVSRMTSSGIGGGGFMTFYNRSSEEAVVLDYRETAGSLTNATMYENTTLSQYYGGGSIATPGEVAGLWEAHRRFGKLAWSRLFEPSISLLENGYTLNEYIARYLPVFYNNFDEELKKMFTNDDGSMKKAGDTVVSMKLAQTYRRIAQDGMDTFYNGTLRDHIVADLIDIGNQVVTASDLETFQVTERKPLIGKLRNGDFSMISLPPPSGGVVLQYIMKILDGYNFDSNSVSTDSSSVHETATTFHRIVEAWKFAYAQRSNLGDGNFVNNTETLANMTDTDFADSIRTKITDDMTHDVQYYGLITDSRVTTGTSQISVLAGNGDAVSVTTSVNSVFGAKVMGNRTGILFNNLMGDFSLPNKPSYTDDAWTAPSYQNNWIKPGKKPLSSMSPTIVLDKNGDVRLVTGGAGGSKIITAAAMTMINNLWFDMSLPEAVATPRLHHQLLPDNVFFETGFPKVYQDELIKRGHNLSINTFLPVSDSVSREDDSVYGVGDHRREGASDGY